MWRYTIENLLTRFYINNTKIFDIVFYDIVKPWFKNFENDALILGQIMNKLNKYNSVDDYFNNLKKLFESKLENQEILEKVTFTSFEYEYQSLKLLINYYEKKYIEDIKKDGDTVGGIIRCHIDHAPAGLGEPVFDKLHANLAKAMMSINAAHGFEYGSGFEGACTLGSQNNDAITKNFSTHTNNAGGILGGISTGDQIYFNVAFKPVATILKPQQSIDRDGNAITLQNEGRHDPCVLPRAVPIVEAMAALVMIDMLLQQKAIQ